MENYSAEQHEQDMVTAFLQNRELAVPLIEADSFVESLDKTGEYVVALIKKYGIEKIGKSHTVTCIRYTEEHGHHLWVSTWTPPGA